METAPPAPTNYRLRQLYATLEQAVSAGRLEEIDAALSRMLGMSRRGGRPSSIRASSMLSYAGFKPSELVMLADNLKPVVKFEDVPLADADAFEARHGGHFQLDRTGAYAKDGLMLRTRPLRPGDQPLVTIYAARDDRGRQLRKLEEEHRDDVRGAGRLLGFPECCIEAFAVDVERSRADEDTLNDDACVRVLGAEPSADPRVNPLSNYELLGFYPCRPDCPRALAMAEATLAALERRRPGAAAATVDRLSGSFLFFRLPFFVRFPGQPDGDGWVSTEGATVNLFPHEPAATVQRRFAALFARALAGAEAVRSGAGGVVGRRGKANWPITHAGTWPPTMVSFGSTS